MKNLTKLFINAQIEFKNSKASEQSVEQLYDLAYSLENKERSINESYILAQIYNLLGRSIEASKIIKKNLLITNKKESKKFNNLLNEINRKNPLIIKKRRDLREARIIKKPTKLSKGDFIIVELKKESLIEIKINENVKNLVIANKILRNGNDIAIFISSNDLDSAFKKLIDFIEWLGELKMELIHFYNNSSFEYKLNKVGQEWFDSLDVSDLLIELKENNRLTAEIVFHDYKQNDFGFSLSIEDERIQSIEYDPIL